jgi:hypothetical protein
MVPAYIRKYRDGGELGAIDLAHRIDGILAEVSSGGWSEEEIRQEFAGPVLQHVRDPRPTARVKH